MRRSMRSQPSMPPRCHRARRGHIHDDQLVGLISLIVAFNALTAMRSGC